MSTHVHRLVLPFAVVFSIVAAAVHPAGAQAVAHAPASTPPSPSPSSSAPPGWIARWIDAQTFQLTARYHFVSPSTPAPDTDQVQTFEQLRFRVKADPAGRVAVAVGFSSGPSFTGGWNDTGIGTGSTRLHVSLRLLSLDVAPIAGVAVQAGSLQPARGEATEFTTYDNDGYVTGERISIRRPRALLFDEVTVTRGYLGDAAKPSVFDRTRRMADVNYRQYLVARHAGSRAWLSAEFDRYEHADIVRAAARVRVPELRVIDGVRYEQYVRAAQGARAAGFAVTGEKQVTRPLALSGGYGDIDRDYGGLNADRFNRGRRVFGMLTYAVSPVLTFSSYVGQAVWNDYPVANRTRVDFTLAYNLLGHLQRAGLLR